ncbi:MAG: gamma-glutamyl-gamma-aminobutyrate hydrolase family protein [Xanthomonadales bacterium]|nr:gamma-glutamyl-gamma-aminobutyrate hydrolase family protein [Xanthomonadales bacterium]
MDRQRRPLIGVTGPRRGAWGPRICTQLALWLSGAAVRQLRPGDPLDTAGLDAVVIGGGHDVEPVLYKAVEEVEGRYDVERDAFESRIIDCALVDETPLLGICRGAQLLNVRLGGSLHQDLRRHRRRTSNRRTLLPLKTLCLEQGTQVSRLLGTARVRINSLHQQSIDRLGEGLVVSGRDLDRIVQAVEYPQRRYLVGVQWHPEFLLYIRRQRHLFQELAAAAREYARRRDGCT